MNGFAERLAAARRQNGMTQNEVAERLGVSFQAVSLWERGETSPDIEKLVELASVFQVSADWLLTGNVGKPLMMDFQDTLSDRLFDENRMYTYVKTYATAHHLYQTAKVLPYVRALHEGQFRRGKDHVPYIYHPLLISCHALALGLDDDDLVSTALLHDVCEDCGVAVDDLPVNEKTKQAVALLTNTGGKSDESLERYYAGIVTNPIATMVKLLDRCNNISGMATGFSTEKMASYIKETQKWVYPLLRRAKNDLPMYSNQIFLIKYHITSVAETVKHM
ncbi:MAG: helix-turn-helix domain-containing protein [Lachnospiraceae bacterium]|nr:helix-turn-helix domain-containing protein [Lachnospiraceae bacterium]